MLERAFLLRSCSDSVYESRTRPCLLHQIKRCSAPCTGEIGLEEYQGLVDEAVALPARREPVACAKCTSGSMQEASEALEFERAAKYRNRLWALAHVQAGQAINPEGVEEADVIAAFQDGRADLHPGVLLPRRAELGQPRLFPQSATVRFRWRRCSTASWRSSTTTSRCRGCCSLSHDIANQDLLAEALSIKVRAQGRDPHAAAGHQVLAGRACPDQRHAKRWAAGSRKARRSRSCSKPWRSGSGFAAMPRRIEVYDNSHIMGTNAVGGMIVAGCEGFAKKPVPEVQYQAPRSLTPGDDYGMMREVLTRALQAAGGAGNRRGRQDDCGYGTGS